MSGGGGAYHEKGNQKWGMVCARVYVHRILYGMSLPAYI